MKYQFKSLFNREKVYTIDCEEPLDLYDDFSLSIKRVDSDIKSFSADNIDCVLKYCKHGTLDIKRYELDSTNFSGYHLLVENLKRRNCVSLGEGLEIVRNNKNEFEDVSIDDADSDTVMAFNQFIKDNDIMDALFKCFLNGVSYGKKLNPNHR